MRGHDTGSSSRPLSLVARLRTRVHGRIPETSQHAGVVNISGWLYDLMVGTFTMRGKEEIFRTMTLDLAGVKPEEAVLDIGCGTGTLALYAQQRVGVNGRVVGVDPSVPLIQQARRKARHSGLPVDFRLGGIEELSLADAQFDVVIGTFMTHHMPDEVLRRGLAEVFRVLEPGGRVLLIDFETTRQRQPHGRSGVSTIGAQDLPETIEQTGFTLLTYEVLTTVSIRSLSKAHKTYGYTLGRKPRTGLGTSPVSRAQ